MADPKFRLKLPEIKREGQTGSKTRLYVLLGILAVVSVAAVVVNISLLGPGEPGPPNVSGDLKPEDLEREIASLLPQTSRQEEQGAGELGTNSAGDVDPFALPMELQGVITGGKKDLAIIKARQTTYIVSTGEQIAGSWELVEISRDAVRLKNGSEEIVIVLGSRN
ncbi:MAG TPA: hypothetical protein GXX34_01565 [Clostridia bacterium]|nr:hypothetical protein [Clostridia bacterium]